MPISSHNANLSVTTAILIAIGLLVTLLITPHLITLISQATNPEMFLSYCQSAPELLTEPNCVAAMTSTDPDFGIEP